MATDFGTDIRALPDLSFETISGLPNLQHALYRRLTTPRGGLFYDPDYGTDLRRYLNTSFQGEVGAEALAFEIEQVVTNEVEKDPRVRSAGATVTFGALGTQDMTIRVTIVTANGPFALVITAESLANGTVNLAKLE